MARKIRLSIADTKIWITKFDGTSTGLAGINKTIRDKIKANRKRILETIVVPRWGNKGPYLIFRTT